MSTKKFKMIQGGARIRGTYPLTRVGMEVDEVRSLILRRRLQILVHSYLYYVLDDSIISDHTWSKWAMELVELQNEYPRIAERVDYHQEFKEFDGSTGYNLPIRNPEISSKAQFILRLYKKETNKV